MADDWLWMTAAELGRGIDAGRIDPVALTETYLDACAAHAFGDRIYARLTADRARAEAAAAADRARRGLRKGPLDGVPISWKDLFDTTGIVTEAGSALLEGRMPARDAWVLQNATEAGLVCLGKTHMSELAFSGLGLNPVTATPPCVNDHDAVPGGSSSGAATSVAFGLAAAGIGSDTGGSVRLPSAWNDLVGLKTTAGRIPLDGVVPLCLRFDTIGPLCRSVEDAALLLAALEGGRPADLNGARLDGARFLVPRNTAFDDIRDAPRAAFDSAVDRLRRAGAEVVFGDVPAIDQAMPLAAVLYASEAYGLWEDVIEAAPEKMFRPILERFRAGADVRACDYVAAWRALEDLRRQYEDQTGGFDAVLVPTSPITPPNAKRLIEDNDFFVTENLLALRNTRIGNLLGLCVLTLPTGVPSTGISFMAAPYSEERLLRIGVAAESALA